MHTNTAELLSLYAGVSIWNGVIVFESCDLNSDMTVALVRVRHVSVDCMFMAHTVLNGISRQYKIDTLSLLRFFTICGHKYAKVANDIEMAQLCYDKASEFLLASASEDGTEDHEKPIVARAHFDLAIGQAECAWGQGDSRAAENFVSRARTNLEELPGEHEFLASVEYNFGLYSYQAKNIEFALKWLKRSIDTRGSRTNPSFDKSKQARTMRLAGVCLLAAQSFEESWDMMKTAEDLSHDPSGAYLMLKLSIIAKKPNALEKLLQTIKDESIDLDISMASVALFADSQRIADAVQGYKELSGRFKMNQNALVCTIGPRHFEALAALGRVNEALEVLDKCCNMIPKLSVDVPNTNRSVLDKTGSESTEFSRWAVLAFAAGCECADRNDFESAATLLDRSLKVARTASTCALRNRSGDGDSKEEEVSSNIVMEHEASICRFASSCALCSFDELAKGVRSTGSIHDNDTSDDIAPTLKEKRDKMIKLALDHGTRAKELERTDFTPRMLLFRARLMNQQHEKAALELLNASRDIKSFDAAAVAEAACAAHDVASPEAVVSALRCVIELDTRVLLGSLNSGSDGLPRGCYGAMLVACVDVMRRGLDRGEIEEGNDLEEGETVGSDKNLEKVADLACVMKAGLRGLKALGTEDAFIGEQDVTPGLDELQYLADIAWNEGRTAGIRTDYEGWEDWFEMCYNFCEFLPKGEEVTLRKRMCKIMSACAVVENDASTPEKFKEARKYITEARAESQLLKQFEARGGQSDPVEGLLFFLEARIIVGCEDLSGLENLVEVALKAQVGGGVLEQLATVCYLWKGKGHATDNSNAEQRSQCTDLAVALLEKAVEVRLREKTLDVVAIAITMRERIGLELSRGVNSGRPLAAFRKAVYFAIEKARSFPDEELRWLAATGWDRTQILMQVGRHADARHWGAETLRLVEDCPQLSSYKPRLDTIITSLISNREQDVPAVVDQQL